MNIIEELYFGNIDPNMKRSKNSRIAKAIQTFSDNEEKLTVLLDGKEKDLFFDLVNAQSEILATSELERFIEGFQLGARFMLDTFIIAKNSVLKDI